MNKNVRVLLLVIGAAVAVLIGSVTVALVGTQRTTPGRVTDHRQSHSVNYVASPSQSTSPTGAATGK